MFSSCLVREVHVTDILSTQQPDPSARPGSGSVETQRTMTCTICQAVYAPSQAHPELLQASPVAFESAFMSMCHFCFRCRRPACPACWDTIHAICGSCSHEVGLPFRSPTPPLQGTLFPPIRQAQTKRARSAPQRFVCIKAGRFHSAPVPIDAVTTLPMPSMTRPQPRITTTAAPPPRHPAVPVPLSTTQQPVQEVPTPPTRSPLPPVATADRIVIDIDKIATVPQREGRHRRRRFLRRLEQISTNLLLLLVILVLALIFSAEMSLAANTFIATTIHIDVRAELTYLWRLIESIHF